MGWTKIRVVGSLSLSLFLVLFALPGIRYEYTMGDMAQPMVNEKQKSELIRPRFA
jgi:hypothetical protein